MAVFDLSSSLAWVLAGRVRQIYPREGWGRIEQAEVLARPPTRPPPEGAPPLLLEVDGGDWRFASLERGFARDPEGRDSWAVELLDMDREEFYASYSGPAPFLVFLDAVHTYEATRTDLRWALQVSADIVCSHDYREEWPGVIRAVDEVGPIGLLVDNLAVQGLTPFGQRVVESVRNQL